MTIHKTPDEARKIAESLGFTPEEVEAAVKLHAVMVAADKELTLEELTLRDLMMKSTSSLPPVA